MEEQRALQGGGVAHRKGKPLEGVCCCSSSAASTALRCLQELATSNALMHTLGMLVAAG